MSSYRQIHNVAPLISTIETLDGTSIVFPRWRSRLDDVLSMQGTFDIVNGTLVRPKADTKAEASSTQTSDYTKGYHPRDVPADWDALSELACSTIKLTLSQPLAQRYRNVKPAPRLYATIVNAYEKVTRARRIHLQDSFWNGKHDPSEPIALWIGRCRVSADDLLVAKQLPTDQQVTNRLIGGLHQSWAPVKDSLMYAPAEVSLDDAISALEAHEVSLNSTASDTASYDISAAAATTKRGCSNCKKLGHKSSECRSKSKTKATAHFAVLGDDDEDDWEPNKDIVFE